MTSTDAPQRSGLASVAMRLAVVLRHAERYSPRTERILLAVALVVFVAGSWFAWQNLPEVDTDPRWWLLAPAAALAVAALAVNAGEFAVATHLLGRRIRFLGAFHVSVLSSAANALPIPGAVVIKTRALRQQGQGYKQSLAITACVGVMWVAVGFVAAGLLQVVADRWAAGAAFLGVGLAGVAFALALLAGAVGRARVARASLPVVAVEVLSVGTAAVRIHLILVAMGFDVPFYQSAALACAAIVASAVGIFPSGLGLRELLSAAMAEVVGLDPAVGLLVSAVDRILMFAVLGVVSLLLLATDAAGLAAATTERASLEDPYVDALPPHHDPPVPTPDPS